ncbi:hypothetical protein DAEQUDRAFT_727667 [Daedalea quercina L-15889]|uniref:F-box domain-containing protein n=1 Tax=Daedalea quercina L-15889 TaxID=1314783 RepID=A0A165PS04_9APHY|nr:hypothetical protein DAEQUDRAFT_727667 [Daedalea quercina L-15889]
MPPLFNTLYRHRGLYFSSYEARPSFRDITGHNLMRSIPRDPSAFAEWLASQRGELDGHLATSGIAKRLPYGGNYSQSSHMITEVRPDFGRTWMDWTYELDLDTLVFSFMAEPMFCLDRMPPPDDCERYITQDHYGLWTCLPDIPEQYSYRANWAQPTPISENSLESPVAIQMNVPVDELLGTSSADKPDSELVCTRFYEVIVGQYFREYHHGFHQCSRPGADDDSEESEHLRDMLLSLLWPAVTRMIYKSENPGRTAGGSSQARRWPRDDLFFQVFVDMRSEAALRALAASLATDLRNTGCDCDRVFGVLFSGAHVAIVSFEGLQGCLRQPCRVSCTALLPFLPDRFGASPSSPGIDALVRLGQAPHPQLDYSILFRMRAPDAGTIFMCSGPPPWLPPLSGRGLLVALPHEILSLIIGYLDDSDLHDFAAVSRQTYAAVRATRRIRYPVIDGQHRLVQVRPLHFAPQVLPDGNVLLSEEFYELVSAAFVTEDDKVLLLGFNPAIDVYLIQINWMSCWGSGTIAMPHVLGRQIRIPYIVLSKADVEHLENDATSENLLGRICRRGVHIMDQMQADNPMGDEDL